MDEIYANSFRTDLNLMRCSFCTVLHRSWNKLWRPTQSYVNVQDFEKPTQGEKKTDHETWYEPETDLSRALT